jgi:hypothetical protein
MPSGVKYLIVRSALDKRLSMKGKRQKNNVVIPRAFKLQKESRAPIPDSLSLSPELVTSGMPLMGPDLFSKDQLGCK